MRAEAAEKAAEARNRAQAAADGMDGLDQRGSVAVSFSAAALSMMGGGGIQDRILQVNERQRALQERQLAEQERQRLATEKALMNMQVV
jgi:hypothetical protein